MRHSALNAAPRLMTSRRLIAAWPRSSIPISTPGTRRRKSASKRFRLPMVCSPMRISAHVMTGARSTPAVRNNRDSAFTKTLRRRPRLAILTKTILASPILPIRMTSCPSF